MVPASHCPRAPRALAIALLALTVVPRGSLGQGDDGFASFLDRVEVRVLNVDVVVLDSDGNPWPGLLREDFEIFENGEPIEISNFAAYDASVAADEPVTTAADLEDTAVGNEPSALRPPPVTWVVYVDQSRLETGPRNLVLRETREFLDQARQPEELAMVSTWDGHRLRVVSELSTDPRALDSALTDLQREAGPANFRRARAEQLERDILSVGATTVGGDPAAARAESPADQMMAESLREEVALDAEQGARETRLAIEGFRDLLGLIDGIDGRVVLLFAGGGYDLDPGVAMAELWSTRFGQSAQDTVTPGTGVRASHLAQDYLRTLQELNSGRVTVHTIFAGPVRGLDVGADRGSSSIEFGALTTAAGAAAAGSTLSAFAEETGGRAFNGAADLTERLEAVRRDLGLYYSLGYHPGPAPASGLRKIEVRVRREGARVVHRSALAERTPEERAEAAAFAALLQPESAATGAARIEALEPRDGPRGRGRVLPVRIALPLRDVALLPDGTRHRGALRFHFALSTPDGGYLRFEPRRLDFEVANDELAKALGSAVTYQVELPLEPGRYRLGVSVQDELAGSYRTLVAALEMPRGR